MRNHHLLPAIAGIALLPFTLTAEASNVSGPSLGLVFDSETAQLRPILGIPGAATLGDPLVLEFGLSSAAISPAKGYALALRSDDASVMLVRADGAVSALPVSESSPSAIAFNQTGTIAALYFSSSKRVQIIEGLPGSPKLASNIDASGLAGTLTALAVSADGASLSAALDADAYLISADGTSARLGSFRTISALRFVDNGANVLVADADANAIYLVQSATGETTQVASERDGIEQPSDLALDGRRIFVANKASGTILIIDRDGAPPSSMQCACKPTALARLSGSSAYRLTEAATGTLWMIDAGRTETPILAIPMGARQ